MVTGAGRGVGRGVAIELARRGARIVAVGRTRENIEQTIAELKSMGGSGVALVADICETDWLDRLEPIDIVVHNACAYAPFAQIINSDVDQMRQVLETCVVAPTRISKRVLPGMKRRGFGRIVFIGSVAASLGAHGQAAYCAAKSALVGLTRTIALESSAWGVTCNLVQLGLIETERIAKVVSPAVRERIIGATAMGRIGTVEEAAYVVACLASPRASFITGAVINASGGLELGIRNQEDSHAD